MFYKKIFLLLALGAVILPWQINSAKSQPANSGYISARPAPPRRIPPNKVKPGGGLDIGQQACSSDRESLIALIPIDNPVLTTQSHPSFLFYVPDEPSAINHGEFSLFTADEKTRIYSTNIALESTPGVIKIDLPESPQYALKSEEPYHWYFKIHCQSESSTPSYVDVDGWIERVALTDNRASQIDAAEPDVWYDAIAQVAKNLIAAPQNAAMRDRWSKLLQYIDREYLRNVSIHRVTTTPKELSRQN